MNYYNKEIVFGYNYLKKKAIDYCHNGNVEEAISCVEKLSVVANQLNWTYHDEDLSCLIDELSQQLFTHIGCDYSPIKKRAVFYDQYGKSFILALQYIDALVYAGYEILYVLSDYVEADPSTFIINELRAKQGVTVSLIPLSKSYKERGEEIIRLTQDFAPEKIFLHVKSFSVFNLVLPTLPCECIKYYIDLQDHAMWIKNHQINYVIPYRVFGATIEMEKRGFAKEQILHIPYYPIIRESAFQGFPKNVAGKVVVFTGGEFYKTMDRNNTYWKIVANLLVENPSVVVLYAMKGKAVEHVKKVIGRYGKSVMERFVQIGFRSDINEVFQHSDIYLGTSPMSGGLMCQYAAFNAKPILQYYNPEMAANNETEQVLNYNDKLSISFTDKRELLREAKRLVDDEEYRQERGRAIQKCLITKNQFDELFAKTIESNLNCCSIEPLQINYKAFENWWFYLEKSGISRCREYLLSLLKNNKYKVMPLSAVFQWLSHRFAQ